VFNTNIQYLLAASMKLSLLHAVQVMPTNQACCLNYQ